jgi:hypothetical protein
MTRQERTIMPIPDPATIRGDRRARALWVSCLLGVCTLVAAKASAEELGEKQNIVFSGERLFGFYIDNQSVGNGSNDVHRDHTVFAFGWQDSQDSTLTVPRLGIDYFVTRSITLGGNIGLFSHHQDVGRSSSTSTGVLFGARVGYAFRLSHAVSFWPRAGLTYTTVSTNGFSGDAHVFSLSLDAPFTFAPSENFAILLGPCLEIGMLGKQNGDDYGEILFGVMIGLAGWVGL